MVNVLSSILGATDEVLSAGESFLHQFKALWISDSLGILIVAPLILAWSREGRRHLYATLAAREIEAAVVFTGLVLSTHFVFSASADSHGWIPQWQHLTIPFLVWAALRFGLRGSTLAIAIYALMTLWYTAHGTGPFATPHEKMEVIVLALQVYLGVIGVMILIGAALMTEAHAVSVRHRGQRQPGVRNPCRYRTHRLGGGHADSARPAGACAGHHPSMDVAGASG